MLSSLSLSWYLPNQTYQVEDQIFVVGRSHSLPLHEEESRDDRMLEKMLVLLRLTHVPKSFGFRQRKFFVGIGDVTGAVQTFGVFLGPVRGLGCAAL
jgi:hypothetical protein